MEFVGDRENGVKLYRVRFNKLGENMLTVKYGDGQWSALQFFVTEPLETVISKRARFLVNQMQHDDPNQWWYGVFSDWDQLHKQLRSPIDRDGLSPWLTDASDDAGNARPAFVASKNVFFPDQKEIDSVELYIKQYLFSGHRWDEGTGGMQMTEQEPYPYGIYGTFDNWYQHRTIDPMPPANFVPRTVTLPQDVGWTRLHREHLWRIYDYPHIMLMYFRMYQIAKAFPTMVHYANAGEYLMLAYNTSVAYWTVPMKTDKPRGWSANSVPTMNEAFVPELITALEREGKESEAARLRELWNGKVAHYVSQRTRPNLFGSEFAFDSTGFESTGAMAHYAMDHAADSEDVRIVHCRPSKRVPRVPIAIESRRSRLVGEHLLSTRKRLPRRLELFAQLYVADGRVVDSRLRLVFCQRTGGILAPGLCLEPQFVGARQFRNGRKRIWILVAGQRERRRDGRRIQSGTDGHGLDTQGRSARCWYYSAEEDVGYCGR